MDVTPMYTALGLFAALLLISLLTISIYKHRVNYLSEKFHLDDRLNNL